VAIATYGIPFRLNIVIAIVAALVVGLMTDKSPKASIS
jgi:ribosome biogenesis protein Tsr3